MDEKQGINEVLTELMKDEINPELIQNNKIHFRVSDDIYRVRMPNQKENSNATGYKNKTYIRLIQEDNTLTIKQLKKILKEKKDIDIDDLDKKASELEKEMTQVYLTLAKKKTSEKSSITKLKSKLETIRDKRLVIILEKAEFLSPAIENQAQDEYYRFLTAMCTDKLIDKKNDKWEQVWISFNKYEQDDSKLPYLSLGRLTELVYGA